MFIEAMTTTPQGNVTTTSVEMPAATNTAETKNRYDDYYLTADGKYMFAKRDVNL